MRVQVTWTHHVVFHTFSTDDLDDTERNLLPLKLDERTDCKFALPFNYNSDSTMNPGRFWQAHNADAAPISLF